METVEIEWVAFKLDLTEEEAEKIVGHEAWPPIPGPWPLRVRERLALWLVRLLDR